jgi:hypothetical protein
MNRSVAGMGKEALGSIMAYGTIWQSTESRRMEQKFRTLPADGQESCLV